MELELAVQNGWMPSRKAKTPSSHPPNRSCENKSRLTFTRYMATGALGDGRLNDEPRPTATFVLAAETLSVSDGSEDVLLRVLCQEDIGSLVRFIHYLDNITGSLLRNGNTYCASPGVRLFRYLGCV